MQNQHIVQNHIIDPNYRYKAWYKARNAIHAGENITPKTDIGPYVVGATGDIVFHAGEEIVLEPGFSTDYGAIFEATIVQDNCSVSYGLALKNSNTENQEAKKYLEMPNSSNNTDDISEKSKKENSVVLYPNPNSGSFTLQLPESYSNGRIYITDMLGKQVYAENTSQQNMELRLDVPRGLYLLRYADNSHLQTLQFIVR